MLGFHYPGREAEGSAGRQTGGLESLLQEFCSKRAWKTFPNSPIQAPVVFSGKPRHGKFGLPVLQPKSTGRGEVLGKQSLAAWPQKVDI